MRLQVTLAFVLSAPLIGCEPIASGRITFPASDDRDASVGPGEDRPAVVFDDLGEDFDGGPIGVDVPDIDVQVAGPDAGVVLDVPVVVRDVMRVDLGPRPTPTQPLRAFPGAMGFGAGATGGRGGRVVYVTNLNASGSGSFAAAMAMTGPRYVLFRVSGVIPGPVWIGHGDVTIAGQTSPGGVIIRGLYINEEPYCDQNCGARVNGVDNVIIRHIRSRPNGDDGIRLRYTRNTIVDHCSIGNATDEAIEVSFANNVTIQNTLLAETVGDHAQYGGLLVNYSNPAAGYGLDRLSFLRNNWNRLMGRYPELSRESPAAAGTTLDIEVSNNLIWDQFFYIETKHTNGLNDDSAGSPVYYHLNWVGNVSYARSNYAYGLIWFRNPTGRSTAFFDDNHSNLYPSRTDWQFNWCCNDFRGSAPPAARPSWGRAERHPFDDVQYIPASELRQHMVDNVGAFPRDPMDTRLMEAVANESITMTAANRNPAGDALRLPFTTPPPAPVDTDNDGMPDEWELRYGLDPRAQDHNGTELSVYLTGAEGYTNLECYLAWLSDERISGR
ncbi:MAG: right-handed parallel beta-helix repeat-containing protein [Polyangiales bacterium]